VKKFALIAAFLIALAVFAGYLSKSAKDKKVDLRIVTSYGLGYAPVYVISELKLVEKYYPNANVSIKRYGSSVALRNAVMEENVDILFSSLITPLILEDTGVNFKIAAGVGTVPYYLMVSEDSEIQSLEDFNSQNRIAIPGFASIPHLSIYTALDNHSVILEDISSILQTMADPIGYDSLVTGDVTAHFTTLPYSAKERANGFRSILSARDLLGDVDLVASVSKDLKNNYPEIYAAFYAALAEAVELINIRDVRALKAISKAEGISMQELNLYLDEEGVSFTTKINDSMRVAEMLRKFGFITDTPINIQDFMWESASSMLGREWKYTPKEISSEMVEASEETENGEYIEYIEDIEDVSGGGSAAGGGLEPVAPIDTDNANTDMPDMDDPTDAPPDEPAAPVDTAPSTTGADTID
jgi:NitT/TauT family transport system substrate-binding protein